MRHQPSAASALLAGALGLALTGCGAPAAVVELTSDTAPQQVSDAAATHLSVALQDLENRFAVAEGGTTSVVSADASVQVAAQQLQDELGLGQQARDFLAAFAFELGRLQAEASGPARSAQVDAQAQEALADGDDLVVRIDVTTTVAPRSGPAEETRAAYAVTVADDAVEAIRPYLEHDGGGGVDAGRGLASPQGAVQRYLDLVSAGDRAAVERMAQPQEVTSSAFEVLRTAQDSAGKVHLVGLPASAWDPERGPSEAAEGEHVVYAIASDGAVLGRFAVTVGERIPQVLYAPTA